MSTWSASQLRRRIRRDIPEVAFSPRPRRALWFVPLVAVASAGTFGLARGETGIVASLLLWIVVGNVYASSLLLAHEIMHGAVVRGRRMQHTLSWFGFLPFLISPTLWRAWHNEAHHGHTNRIDRDPDLFAGEAMHASSRASRAVLRFVPGSGGAASALFPFVWFCVQGQIVLWFLSVRMPGFERLDRKRAKLEVAAMITFWVVVAMWAGWSRFATAILAPMAIGNCVLMSYIATNHLLRPLVARSDPLRSSMSVRTPALLDRLHLRFSHHVEHHLFPSMSGADLPRVRAWLREHVPDEYVCPSHATAIAWLYRTPRTYRDATTLIDPRRPSRPGIDLERLGRILSPLRREA